jgi:molecular chaperone Hsp33
MNDKIFRIITTQAALRTVVVWMPETAQTILSQHHPSPQMGEYLANAAVASLLLASNLKGPGAVSMRLETNGIIGLMNADGTPDGLVRAMIPKANIKDESVSKKLKLPIIGPGTIFVTKTYNDARKPYTGVSEIHSPYIGPIVADYLLNSEQVKSSVSTATLFQEDKVLKCCGFLVEALPELLEEDLVRIENNIKGMGNFWDFMDSVNRPEELIEELLSGFSHEIIKEFPVRFYCPCSQERVIISILGSGEKEVREIIEEDKEIEVFCDYCRKQYMIQPSLIEKAFLSK